MQQPHGRTIRLTAIALTSAALTGVFAVYFIPVGPKEERAATVLSKTGPQGQAAYRAAWSDGRLTRADMYEIRDASGHEIDNWVDMSGRTS
ncbi:hypothetical protein J2Y58_002515 [Sphingomonas sp. BE138]|uniref:hypothetical protein n=1 Tax=Sphingomonas sp. BE138 TaxID=2817845 RepID=UPI002865961A|nr:hypothetical protein [Sphingomonas sp. BE138]MDR6789144.1 hypothetical protein [Sphingomonas sp. BE138]